MQAGIIVNLRVEGVHCWPECTFPEVVFLKSPHRHVFHVQAKKTVSHLDRDIEIIMLKRKIQNHLLAKFNGDFGSMSCEMIAEHLLNTFGLNYCSVLEDGENGAEVWNA